MSNDTPGTRTVIYAAGTELKQKHLTERLRRHHQTHLPPEKILLIAPKPQVAQLQAITKASEFIDSLPDFTRHVNTPRVEVVGVDIDGLLYWNKSGKYWSKAEQSALESAGLRDIFTNRGGLIKAGSSFHYINPSNRHTSAFIRTGNVLMHSAEVGFMAFGLLKSWPNKLRHIFTDTASINAVAYSLIELRSRFEVGRPEPTVDSFSSYDGLLKFDFDQSGTLCLISASTSGSLERKLTSGSLVPSDRVVTLFYCGEELSGGNVLCDLTDRNASGVGIRSWPSYKTSEECQLCKGGSATIRMSGDAFLPATPSVDSIVLQSDHAPPELGETLTELIGSDAIHCHANHEPAGSPREIYLDLTKVIASSNSPFAGRLKTRLVSMVPASLERIVYLDDPSSKALANEVREHYLRDRKEGSTSLLMSSVDARDQAPDLGLNGGAVIVVAGAACSGRELLSISQFMRQVKGLGHLSYLIGTPRLTSKAAWNRLRSNLTYGEEPSEFPLVSIRHCYLPDGGGSGGSPWASEIRDLQKLKEMLQEGDELKAIENRIGVINNAASMDASDNGDDRSIVGLRNDLFLERMTSPDLLGAPTNLMLRLREGFAFWRGIDRSIHKTPESQATQAEVYFTVAMVLHRLRQPQALASALVQHQHNRTVLGPANFARFNDGVIQASILRAARPGELDYSHDEELSGEMRDLLQRYWVQRYEHEGEAFPEFLLALAREKLKLTDDDVAAIAACVEPSIDELPPLVRAWAKQLRVKFPAQTGVASPA